MRQWDEHNTGRYLQLILVWGSVGVQDLLFIAGQLEDSSSHDDAI
jgi:hypothetical protein